MDFGHFLYYGQVAEDDEIEADLTQGLLQDRRSLFYYRDFGSGLSEYENAPDGLSFQIGVRYDVAAWIARRNSEVSDGSNGTRDRRVATSQSVIEVTTVNGVKEIRVPYLAYSDIERPRMVSAPLGL